MVQVTFLEKSMKSSQKRLLLAIVVIALAFAACDNLFQQKDKGTLSYDANGGYGTVPPAQTADISSKITVASKNNLIRNGYFFYGWNTKKTGDGVNYAAGSTLTLTGDIVLYARWVYGTYPGDYGTPGNNLFTLPGQKTINVVYDKNGANSGVAPTDPRYVARSTVHTGGYALGDEVEVLGNTGGLKKDGYKFMEWITHKEYDSAGDHLISGDTFTIEDHHVVPDADNGQHETVYLYAHWVKEDAELSSEDPYAFPKKEYGYSQVDAKTMTLRNIGNGDSGPLYVLVSGHIGAFTITPGYNFTLDPVPSTATRGDKIKGSITNVAARSNMDFTIVPKNDLKPGNYSVTIKVFNKNGDFEGSNIRASFIVSFTVTPYRLTVTAGSIQYKNPAGKLTPIVSDIYNPASGYTEAAATFKATVAGFKTESDVKDLMLDFALSNGLIVTEQKKVSYSNGAQTFDVTVIYDGQNPDAIVEDGKGGIEVKLNKDTVTPYYSKHAREVLPIDIIDGLAESRPIPVNTINTATNNGFNYYAGTPGGLVRHYKQTEDITLPAVAADASNWTAIGSYDGTGDGLKLIVAFTGGYDGGGKTIKGLAISTADNNQGMFGYIGAGSTVKDLKLENVNITITVENDGKAHAGGVAGRNEGTVINCSVTGISAVTALSSEVIGGVVGWSVGTVENCVSYATVTGTGMNIGGVVGTNGSLGIYDDDSELLYTAVGTVRDSNSYGTVTGTSNAVGGVVGSNEGGTVQNSNSYGSVSGGNSVGGVVGNNGGTVQNCNATGPVVTGSGDNVGGVVGNNSGTVQNCNATGNVTGGGSFVGGVAGSNAGTVKTSNFTGNVTGNECVGGVVGQNGDKYSQGTDNMVENCYYTGTTVHATAGSAGGVVGNNEYGTVQKCYVTGATVTTNGNTIGGVVGRNFMGTVKQCFAANTNVTANVRGDNKGRYVGGVVGWSAGTVQNCYASGGGTVTGGTYVGGVVGRSNGGTSTVDNVSYGPHSNPIVEYCYTTVTVVASDADGATASGGAQDFAGGVLGHNWNNAKLQNNVALNPSVTATKLQYVGRVLGRNFVASGTSGQDGATPVKNYARAGMTVNSVTVSASYSSGVDNGANIYNNNDNGADVNWNSASFWTTAGNWNGSAWNAGVWNIADNKLPTLKDMPGNPVQNPAAP